MIKQALANKETNRLLLLGWGQICWSSNVGAQKLNHLTSNLNNKGVINMIIQNCILFSVKHFSPTNSLVLTFTEIDQSQTGNLSQS